MSRPPLAVVNDLDRLRYQLDGILGCVSAASGAGDDLPDEAIAGACWAARDLLGEMHRLATAETPPLEGEGVAPSSPDGAA